MNMFLILKSIKYLVLLILYYGFIDNTYALDWRLDTINKFGLSMIPLNPDFINNDGRY